MGSLTPNTKKKMTGTTTFEPPAVCRNYDCERGLLSSCQDGDFDFEQFAYALEQGITADHFHSKACQEYWMALVESEKGGNFGMVDTLQRLGSEWMQDNPRFIEEVLHSCDTSIHGKKWVDGLVRAKGFMDLWRLSTSLANEVQDAETMTEPSDVASLILGRMENIVTPSTKTLMNSKELSEATGEAVDAEMQRGGAAIVPYLPWLRDGLDGGFRAGQVCVVAARPSVGKTTFAVNLVYHAAFKKKRSLIFSMEMTGEQIGRKLAMIHTGKDLSTNTGSDSRNKENAELIKTALRGTSELPIHVDDGHSHGMGSVKAISKVLKRRSGLDAVVIDYLGLLRPDPNIQNREQQVAEISRQCKIMAKELDIVVFLVCQLNRESVKGNREPALHDLRESGQIEQDADIVILLHRDLLSKDKEDVKVIVAKNRYGGCGHSKDRIRFDMSCQRFNEVEQPRQPRLNGMPVQTSIYDGEENERRI